MNLIDILFFYSLSVCTFAHDSNHFDGLQFIPVYELNKCDSVSCKYYGSPWKNNPLLLVAKKKLFLFRH